MSNDSNRTEMIRKAIAMLHEGGHTLVVANGNVFRTFDRRGVADLYRLLREEPEFLRGAVVADKVVGKAAAALMLLGGVAELHTDIISGKAIELLHGSSLRYAYDLEVPHIINRTRDGWCPLETRCRDCRTAEECLTQIEAFIASRNA